MALDPQAAIERAVLETIRSRLGYSRADSDRCFDGRPPPFSGKRFLAVWSPADRASASRTCLDERFEVRVTLTVRFDQPFDRRTSARDELEKRLNAVRALVHADIEGWEILRAANQLAGYGYDELGGYRAVGFCESLAFEGFDVVQERGGEWFSAAAQQPELTGCSQEARFGRARHVQATTGAS